MFFLFQEKYLSKHNAVFDQLDLVTYEEVNIFITYNFFDNKERIVL